MNVKFLEKTLLFRGADETEIQSMMTCSGAEHRVYEKGRYIYHTGDRVPAMGLVLFGKVYVENNDLWGNRSILDVIGPGQVFAETYACVSDSLSLVDVVAGEKTEILFLNGGRILQTCSETCVHHTRLIKNLLAISAQKNLNLSRRIFHTSAKSIRGRLLSYLSDQATRQGCYEFEIPFNRQRLADYLNVDRSALSNELGKMQKEGILKVKKNQFVLLKEGILA